MAEPGKALMSEELGKALIGSLIPLLITTLFAWLGNKNHHARRSSLIDHARQRIELINAYVSSQALVVGDSAELEAIKRSAADELLGIKHALDCSLQVLHGATEKSESYLLRFLLLYRMRSRRAKFFRTCFFAALAVTTLFSFVIGTDLFSPSSLQKDGIALNVTVAFILSTPGVLFAFLFRWLARRADQRSS